VLGGNSVNPLDDAVKVLSLMNRTTNSRLLVVDRDRPVGVVTLKGLLDFLALTLDPEGEGARVKHLPLGLG
jgi:predicted transcriptional regulator